MIERMTDIVEFFETMRNTQLVTHSFILHFHRLVVKVDQDT